MFVRVGRGCGRIRMSQCGRICMHVWAGADDRLWCYLLLRCERHLNVGGVRASLRSRSLFRLLFLFSRGGQKRLVTQITLFIQISHAGHWVRLPVMHLCKYEPGYCVNKHITSTFGVLVDKYVPLIRLKTLGVAENRGGNCGMFLFSVLPRRWQMFVNWNKAWTFW